ncbi:MAG: SLC13 family permease [Rubripirellula sp.]|nr:SLC13 family permease [Rubripirellula sp.]
MNIWLIVLLAVAVVLCSILIFRLHAFLTLLLAGLLVAALTGDKAVTQYTNLEVAAGKMTDSEAGKLQSQPSLISAPSRLATAFGQTAGKIGILIALASIIGQCLLESKAASVIVDRLLKMTGPKRAPEALAASSFLLGIPVFFDTVFYLMIPLARSLRERVGKNYVLFILAILAGGSIAHSLVPPTPGPLLVAEQFEDVSIANMMVAGLVIGACSSIVSLAVARIINRCVEVPLRFAASEDPHSADSFGETANQDNPANGTSDQHLPVPAQELPSLTRALLPITIPVVLIALGSLTAYLTKQEVIDAALWTDILRGMGDKNIALGIGLVLALSLIKYCPAAQRNSLITRSLASAGNIILITAAGGAFGVMLKQAGIGPAVASQTDSVDGLLLLPLAFVVTAAVRTMQGSATVAMITAAGILQGIASAESLPFHPVYIAMAIGAGSKPISWMTDSAFWVITKMSGMTEAEGLRVISPMSIAMGFSALFFTMLFAWVYPAA